MSNIPTKLLPKTRIVRGDANGLAGDLQRALDHAIAQGFVSAPHPAITALLAHLRNRKTTVSPCQEENVK